MEEKSYEETFKIAKELYESGKIISFLKYSDPHIQGNPTLQGKVVGHEMPSGWLVVRIINPQKSGTGWAYDTDNESDSVRLAFFNGFKPRKNHRFWFIQYSQIIQNNKH